MAPIWMTTRNSSRKSGDTCSFTNSSTRIMCPVDEMGSHSVMPSTMPMSSAFSASMIMGAVPRVLSAGHGRSGWVGGAASRLRVVRRTVAGKGLVGAADGLSGGRVGA